MKQGSVTPEDLGVFVEIYGGIKPVTVKVRGQPDRIVDMTLEDALAFEDALCEVKLEDRSDPYDRLRYMARMVQQHLLPEHTYLLAEQQPNET